MPHTPAEFKANMNMFSNLKLLRASFKCLTIKMIDKSVIGVLIFWIEAFHIVCVTSDPINLHYYIFPIKNTLNRIVLLTYIPNMWEGEARGLF